MKETGFNQFKSMCLRIIFTSFLCDLSSNFFLLSSSHGSNPSSYRHHRLPSRPCRCLIFHSFSFSSRIEHVLKHPSKLKFMKLSFQRAIICMKRVSNNRVVPILLWRCNSKGFQTRNAQCFWHISLYESSKLMILDALERRFEGASEYYFSSIVHL
jgi:hypothetical protein